jgi:3-oxoacyl-[acyl-carrier protein] reductase
MTNLLQNKTILIAGSSRGLGFAIAQEVSKSGANVFLGSRNEASLAESAAKISTEVKYHILDVTRPESIEQWFAAAKNEFGKIDGIVVNAGGPPAGTFDTITEEQWNYAFNLTLMSAVRLVKGALPLMGNGGSIVFITSVSVKEPIDTLILSNVYRAGVTSLAKSLSRHLAPRGIRVNNIMPGRFNTERVKELDTFLSEKQGVSIEAIKEGYEKIIPMGRYGNPSEFANMAVFLLSNLSSYITGATIPVDGGLIKTVW